MTSSGDPWRTLGLAPGASLEDVRRAYRRLAKANHPDAAGEAALPRFLAIQAAYEQIAGARVRRPGSRPGTRGAAPPEAAPREPWRADPDRARASGRADGRRPGARPAGRAGRPTSDAGTPPGGGGADGGATASGDRQRTESTGRSRRGSGQKSRKRATPYSTSYDPADEEPFEPGWTGAGWYGASSGTYWTINPKEYADPRKHGPEYQARARRSRTGWILDEDGTTPDAEPGADEVTAEDAANRPTDRPAAERSERARPGPRPRTRTTAFSSTSADGGDRMPPAGGRAGPAPTASAGSFRGPLLPIPRTPAGRAAVAFLGWPPLALFAASAIGESTGCGRYAASCAEASSPGTWVVGLALLVLLLVAPAVARWSAYGTVAVLVIGVPCAVILSAAGGSNVRDASAPLLVAVLAIAYLAGIAYGLLVPRLAPSA